jgi:hypothetical protein
LRTDSNSDREKPLIAMRPHLFVCILKL